MRPVYAFIILASLTIMALGNAIRAKEIEIDEGRIAFTYPLLFGLAKSYGLADFDGMYTFDKNTESRETPPIIFTVLTKEGKIVASILTQNYANMDENHKGLDSVPPIKAAFIRTTSLPDSCSSASRAALRT